MHHMRGFFVIIAHMISQAVFEVLYSLSLSQYEHMCIIYLGICWGPYIIYDRSKMMAQSQALPKSMNSSRFLRPLRCNRQRNAIAVKMAFWGDGERSIFVSELEPSGLQNGSEFFKRNRDPTKKKEDARGPCFLLGGCLTMFFCFLGFK